MKAFVTIEIPFKEWVKAEAVKLGIESHTLEMRLHRGLHTYPAGLVRGKKRAIKVVIKETRELQPI